MHFVYNVKLSFAYVNDINVNYHILHFQTSLQKIIFRPRVVSDTVDDWNVVSCTNTIILQ